MLDTLYGKFNLLLYFEPTDEHYLTSELGSRPAAVISYRVKLHRYLGDDDLDTEMNQELVSRPRSQRLREEMRRTLYPYVPRWGVGPIELDQFFGY